ncbi:MAG: acyltransferase [Lachnospiraceae bacterium]
MKQEYITVGEQPDKNNIFYISLLNVLACFAVIMLHCNGVFWSRPVGRLWITANLIEVTMYWAVPVFFMNIGVTCMDYNLKYSTKEFLVRRIKKTVIPFLCWSIISLLVSAMADGTEISIRNLYYCIMKSSYMSIYWFFMPLFAIYLSLPLFANVLREKRKALFGYLILYAIVTIAILPLLCNIFHLEFNNAIQPPVAASYVMYVLMGYWIHNYAIPRRYRFIIYGLGIIGWIMHFAGTLVVNYGQETIIGTFKGYLNIPCVMYSVAVFVFFRYLDYDRLGKWFGKVEKAVLAASHRTFGIYLVHFYLVKYLLILFGIPKSSIYWRIGGAFLVFGISYLVVWIMQQIPLVKKIVPR